MGEKTVRSAVLCLAAILAAVAGIAGCGSARARPLEVTYYYMPG